MNRWLNNFNMATGSGDVFRRKPVKSPPTDSFETGASSHGFSTSVRSWVPERANRVGLKDIIWSTIPVLFVSLAVKILLLPARYSTDFEVHRNWMAIAWNYSAYDDIPQWYFEETSKWTIDYPPGFIWWEYFLAHVAIYSGIVPPEVLQISSTPIEHPKLKVFQKLSVIVWDLLLYAGLVAVGRTYIVPSHSQLTEGHRYFKVVLVTALVLLHPCLLLIDHMHFQYNGGMLGILLLCFAAFRSEKYLTAILLYTVLLSLKHIYIFAAPIFGAYFLAQILEEARVHSKHWHRRFVFAAKSLGYYFTPAFSLLLVIMWPVIRKSPVNTLYKIWRRLMPWDRGLTHAYWAPNLWAIYNTIDRVLVKVITFMAQRSNGQYDFTWMIDDIALREKSTAGMVRDLGEHSHAVLPSVRPICCHTLFALSLILLLYVFWRHRRSYILPLYIACAAWCYFFVEWHVHEKAVIYILAPIIICAADTGFEARHFLRASIIFNAAVLPLIQAPMDRLAAVILSVVYHHLSYIALDAYHSKAQHQRRITAEGMMSVFQLYGQASYYKKGGLPADNVTTFSIYCFRCISAIFDSSVYWFGLMAVVGFYLFHPLLIGANPNLEFLPLMLMSCYCAVGVAVIGIELCLLSLRRREVVDVTRRKNS